MIYNAKGEEIWKYDGKNDTEPHQVEQTEFFKMLREDTYINQAESGAITTMTAIMGRMATYSGQMVTWEDAINSNKSLLPETLAFSAEAPVNPDENGNYNIPKPGSYEIM